MSEKEIEEEVPTDDELRGEEPAETPEQQEEPDGKKMVPHGALHAEREEHKKTREKLQALESQWGTAEQRLAELQKWRDEKDAAEKAWTEPQWDEDDPSAQAAVLRKEIQDFRGEAGEFIQTQRQQAEEQQMSAAYYSAKSQFETQNPDADAALAHYWNLKRKEYEFNGVPPQHIEEVVNREFKAVVAHNLKLGRNPVEAMYQSAKLVGYSAQQTTESAADQIDRIDRGQQAGKSLSQTGGKPAGNLSLKTLIAMSDEEFASLGDDDWKKVMGG